MTRSDNGNPQAGQASFGFRSVPENEKARLVRGVFDSVAARYDLMNDLMSGGVHRLWKDEFVRMARPAAGEDCLDLAGGTGDIAFRVGRKNPRRVIAADINASMLGHGRDRMIDRNEDPIEWLCADAEELPLPSNKFDLYTIAFGIRNVTHIDKALAEAHRVLRLGGRFYCLEFSRPAAFLAPIYDAYSFSILPRLGRLIAQDQDSYRYLAESIRKFPRQEDFARMIAAAGFARVGFRNLSAGIAAIHWGWKI